ncbi:MAG: penicillin-binding transpeptidase domain-containing protein, partial [Patescibacteria group bacterium]
NDMVGRDGLELSYDDVLRGHDGQKHVEIDALGREKRIIFEERPQDGKSLRLTIDKTLQEKSEEVLRQWMERFNTTRGVVILSDPKTGFIKSLVSMPSYDNNVFAKGISSEAYQELLADEDRPLFHRALKGEYPSGSTIKPFIGAAALKEGVVDAKTTFLSSGGIRVGRWFFPDWKAGGHGVTNLAKALAESVNTYFYLIGGGSESVNGLGIERMASMLRVFGFGVPTGIDLRGEENGFIPSPDWKIKTKGEPWYIGDTYHVAIGQGDVLVTPLQIHTATSLFANAGIAYQPMLVAALEDPDGRRVEQQPRIQTQEILTQEHIQNIRDGMKRAVTEGSARRLSLLPVSAAGKTGTAQWHTEKKPHAWFAGWAPFEDPEVMITVLVEEGEEGSKSAIGIAYDILSWYFRDRHVDSQGARIDIE